MLRLPATLAAWDTPGFAAALKTELAAQAGELPLQQALASTSMLTGDAVEIMLIGAGATADALDVRIGVFFSGIVAGCSCADDPTPVEPQPEYCELRLTIDRVTALASAAPL